MHNVQQFEKINNKLKYTMGCGEERGLGVPGHRSPMAALSGW